jgi:hypothetical protein
MCVIAVYESNYPKAEDLVNMESMNQHLGGIAWIEGGQVHFRKGINAKEIMNTIREKSIKLPFCIHFRIASIGVVDKKLNHPFPINSDASLELEGVADSVLFHNGTWSEYGDYLTRVCMLKGIRAPEGLISDSRVMAWLAHHYGPNFVSSAIDSESKVCILTPNGITKFGRWHEFKSEPVSNTFFDRTTNYFSGFDSSQMFMTGKEIQQKDQKNHKKHNKVQLQGGKVTCSRSLSFKESSLLQEMLDFGYSMDEIDHKLSIHNDNYDAVYQILMGDYVAPEKLWEQTRGDYYE